MAEGHWVTLKNGVHVYIEDGQSVEEAMSQRVSKTSGIDVETNRQICSEFEETTGIAVSPLISEQSDTQTLTKALDTLKSLREKGECEGIERINVYEDAEDSTLAGVNAASGILYLNTKYFSRNPDTFCPEFYDNHHHPDAFSYEDTGGTNAHPIDMTLTHEVGHTKLYEMMSKSAKSVSFTEELGMIDASKAYNFLSNTPVADSLLSSAYGSFQTEVANKFERVKDTVNKNYDMHGSLLFLADPMYTGRALGVSKYALTTYNELLAEAYSDVMCNKIPSDLSKALFEEFFTEAGWNRI